MESSNKIVLLAAKIKLNWMIYQLINFGIISIFLKTETTAKFIPEVLETALLSGCK